MPFNLYCNASDTTPRLFRRNIRGTYNPSSEDKEKLQSTAFVKALDLLCEGPIEGIVDATGGLAQGSDILKGVYLNETAVQVTAKSNTPLYNFRNVAVAYKKGTEDQSPFYVGQDDDFYWLKDFEYTSKVILFTILVIILTLMVKYKNKDQLSHKKSVHYFTTKY